MSGKGAFPALPGWLTANKMNVPATLRPFATAPEDLAVDFHMARRPDLMTGILMLCASTAEDKPIDREFLLDMPISLRICAVMALAVISDSSPFSWQVRCAAADCGQQNEFELTIGQVTSLAQELLEEETLPVDIDGVPAELRRPTGRDQMDWLTQPDAALSQAMVRTVVVHPLLDEFVADGRSFDGVALKIDEAMDRFDPLLSLHLNVLCPQCGASAEVSPDVAAAALERLSRAQRSAMGDVHRLALHYHWSESEIIRLPQWRRESYLELIEAGA